MTAKQNPRPLAIAACAPAAYGFAPEDCAPLIQGVIDGKECDPDRILCHVDLLLDHQARNLERAGRAGAEVAVIPEDSTRLGGLIARAGKHAFCAEAVQAAYARYLDRVGQLCRKHRMHVVGGVMIPRAGRYYNAAVMQDPTGAVIAVYEKTHLPANERPYTTPGDRLPVFDTAFGRVGLLICWDILFPETYATLALQGADIVFQPTFGHAEEWNDVVARCRAMDWSVPLAVSMWGGNSCVIDQAGNVAARVGSVPDALAVAELTLRVPRKLFHLKDARKDKLLERRPELYQEPPTTEREQ